MNTKIKKWLNDYIESQVPNIFMKTAQEMIIVYKCYKIDSERERIAWEADGSVFVKGVKVKPLTYQ